MGSIYKVLKAQRYLFISLKCALSKNYIRTFYFSLNIVYTYLYNKLYIEWFKLKTHLSDCYTKETETEIISLAVYVYIAVVTIYLK